MRTWIAALAAVTCLGTSAVATANAAVTPPAPGTQKIAGADRYMTAVAMSRANFTAGADGIEAVVIATGADWPDGLAGSAIAGNLYSPLLLTPGTGLHPEVANELRRLKPRIVVIAGGTGVVSKAVEDSVRAIVPNVMRVSGASRYGTAANLSREMYGTGTQTIYIASGKDWADAAAAGAPAGVSAGSLLLADTVLPTETKNELLRLKSLNLVENVIVLGGTGAVSQSTFDQVNAIFGKGPDGYAKTVRVAGRDRFETTANLVGALWDPTVTTPARAAYYVHGWAWPDALSAGAVGASQDAPVLLTRPSCMPAATKSFDTRNSATLTSRIWVGNNAATTTAAC